MTDSQPILSVQDIEAYYGQIQALQGISLDVYEGQIVALLGGNGAGKSTTLLTISGLVQGVGGQILMQGEEITKKHPHHIARDGIVHVPEGRRILKGMSIQDNLELGAFSVKGRSTIAKRMEEVYSLFPILHERRKGDASLLSGGEQQMLAIGRALMAGPKVLLMDEPSMGLAPKLVTETMRIIARLNKAGTTILLVEQNARVALKLAHYGYVLENGEITLQGNAQKLQEDEAVVKAYLGGAAA